MHQDIALISKRLGRLEKKHSPDLIRQSEIVTR